MPSQLMAYITYLVMMLAKGSEPEDMSLEMGCVGFSELCLA